MAKLWSNYDISMKIPRSPEGESEYLENKQTMNLSLSGTEGEEQKG